MNMKEMIQKMTLLESEQTTTECGMDEGGMMPPSMPPMPPKDEGNPVTVNISMNASGKEHVSDLLDMMKNAGLGGAKEVDPEMMPMRLDMERLRKAVDGPDMEMEEAPCEECGESPCCCDEETEEGYDNEPDEQYSDHTTMTQDLSGGINRKKRQYRPAADGDNPMAVENEIYNNLKAQYEELRNKD